jgi:hypothetical protein
MGEDKITVQIPPGWSDSTSSAARSETLLLQLNAPPSYGNSHVVFQLHSLLGPRRESSSHHEAELEWASLQQASFTDARGQSFPNANPVSPSQITQIADCILGGEPAAFFSFWYQGTLGVAPKPQDPRRFEYRNYILHHADQQYPFLYLVEVTGEGAIDQQSMADVKSMLGSWKWGR